MTEQETYDKFFADEEYELETISAYEYSYWSGWNSALKRASILIRKEIRPQGEWIECTKSGMPLTEYGRMMGEKWYGFKCSQCNFIYKGNALIESPYCQKCGADMRGKTR